MFRYFPDGFLWWILLGATQLNIAEKEAEKAAKIRVRELVKGFKYQNPTINLYLK